MEQVIFIIPYSSKGEVREMSKIKKMRRYTNLLFTNFMPEFQILFNHLYHLRRFSVRVIRCAFVKEPTEMLILIGLRKYTRRFVLKKNSIWILRFNQILASGWSAFQINRWLNPTRQYLPQNIFLLTTTMRLTFCLPELPISHGSNKTPKHPPSTQNINPCRHVQVTP